MRKLILLVLLWFVVTYYFPDSRTWLKDVSKPLWVPIVKWDVKEEMAQVGRDVASYEQLTGKVPDRRDWLKWLEYRYSMGALSQDAWGSTYQLKVYADSFAIWSYGPDRTRQTADDFEVKVARLARQRHR